MYRKLSCWITFLFSVAMVLANAAVQAQTPQAAGTAASSTQPAAAVRAPSATAAVAAQTAPMVTGTLHGHIADPTGALIPGTIVTVSTANGKNAGNATADAAGAYQVHGLPAGSYVIEATFEGFAPFVSQPIPLAAGQTKNVDIKMAIETAQQQVVVTEEEGPTVSTDAGNNASAMVLKGADLDALSDDPDELSNELTALAGPSAGPNGGQIYIDGFTGGQLPPKSAIREIRINQNPFSAEFDRIGYGRIEILTKPGTDKLHGRVYRTGQRQRVQYRQSFPEPAAIVLQLPVQRHDQRPDLEDGFVLLQRGTAQCEGRFGLLPEGCADLEFNYGSLQRRAALRKRVQPFRPSRGFAPRGFAARAEEYADDAVPVLPQQPERERQFPCSALDRRFCKYD